MVKEKNIIKKLHVEVDTTSLTDAFYFKDHLDSFFREEIYPEIDTLLQELQLKTTNDIVRFDTIPLKINISNKDSLKDIKPCIISDLKNIIRINNEPSTHLVKSSIRPIENEVNAVIHFYEKGRYPWWFSPEKISDSTLLKRVINDPSFASKARPILQSKNAQKRLVFQLTDIEISKVVLALSKPSKSTIKQASFSKISGDIRIAFWELIFNEIIAPNSSNYIMKLTALVKRISSVSLNSITPITIQTEIVKQSIVPLINLSNQLTNNLVLLENSYTNKVRLSISDSTSTLEVNNHNESFVQRMKSKEIVFEQNSEQIITARIEETKPFETDGALEEGILVQNAGLVLLHPFLRQLFENLGFLSDGKKLLRKRLPEALATLYFLATKQESPLEHELLCEKFLCNIPFEIAVFPAKNLTEEQKHACDEMLSAALSHWSALKTTNIDVLRSEFLMREGKITANSENEKLFIQRKTQDILLEKLPWNLGIMKLPWKKNMVFLDW